jgi:hypothetical protein
MYEKYTKIDFKIFIYFNTLNLMCLMRLYNKKKNWLAINMFLWYKEFTIFEKYTKIDFNFIIYFNTLNLMCIIRLLDIKISYLIDIM